MNKLVSVIILTYNNLQYLEGAFKSVVEQNYENVEVIISDDCSTGISKEKIMGIISKYEASFDVIININEKNLGTVKNFNTAIKISKGDIIVPLSCDDTFIDRDVIKDIVSYFEKSECYVCTSLRKGEMSGRILPDIEDIDLLKKEDVSLLLLRLSVGNFICGATLYYKREVFDKYGFFDEKYLLIEDYPYVYNLTKQGIQIGWLDRVTILYGENGVSKNGKRKPNEKFINDMNTFLSEDIVISKNIIKEKKCKRYINYRIDSSQSLRHKYFIYLKYLDIIMIKIIQKIKKDKRSIFWKLYKDI